MKKEKHTLRYLFMLISIFCFRLTLCAGEPMLFNFTNLNLKDGLSQLSVLAICEDQKGYIWLATRNGLNRYDGEKFTIYQHDNNNPQSISDNHVTTLLPDRHSNGLWAGTTNGLNYIDLETNRITVFQKSTHPNLAGNSITALCADSTGQVWIGTRRGLCRWEASTQDFRTVDLGGIVKQTHITALHTDAQGRLLIGTHDKGLLQCDANLHVQHNLTQLSTPLISDDAVSCIYEDSQHQIWIGTQTKGLNKWDRTTQTVTQFTQHNSGLTDDYIRCITEQHQKLIVGTFDGLSLVDLSTEVLSKYNNFDMNHSNLSHYSVYSLFIDRVGTLWVGTYAGGVNYYNPLNNRFLFYYPSSHQNQKLFNVFGPMLYTAGSLWIATEGGGLFRMNPGTKAYQNYLLEASSQGTYNRNIIKTLLADGETIWCGTNNGGIYKFHIPTQRFSLVHQFDKEKNIIIYTLYRDSGGNIWAGTTSSRGLIRIAPDGKVTDQFPIGAESSRRSFPSIRCFLTLRENVFLMGTRANGLFEYDANARTVFQCNINEDDSSRKLPSNYITTIHRRPNGEIWIGTFGGGLLQYKEGHGIVQTIGTREGLPDNNIYSIVESNSNLWISTDKGISEFNTKTLQPQYYDCFVGSDRLEFTPQGGICLPDGEIYFSGSNGFLSFDPGALVKNYNIPPVVLTQLTVNNKPVQPGDESGLLARLPDDAGTLVLNYNQNNFSIAYCALSYIQHPQNKYAYKLIGHDEDWNEVGERKEAFYTNIAPGEYTFQVIASNNDGMWNRTGKSLHIIIRSPWWKTWWAYTLYTILFLGISYTIVYYMYSKHKLELNLRMKQLEKQRMEEFHQTKIRLFTNFSHELRTPLTLILSPLEELVKPQSETTTGIRSKLEPILKNARKLLLLVNQLMDLQKNQSGTLTLQLASTGINAFLQEIYYAFKQIAENKQIDFRYEAPAGEYFFTYDPSLLEKALFNLLSNAFKFTSAGESVRLILIVSEENNMFSIQVADTGKGIPVSEYEQIFTPFYQVDATAQAKENINGTGIGLSLTQSIVHLHHGEISVQPNSPKGSIFTLTIPNNEAELLKSDISTPEPGIEALRPDEQLPFVPDKRILLVEDNEEIRQYLKECLSPYYQVSEADNGSTAFEKIQEEMPDLVVTDIMMPGIDGLELCSLIKNDLQTGHIPVILLTARTLIMQVKEGYLTGADDYVMKPFNIDVLLIRIYNLLVQREKLKSTYGKNFSLQSLGLSTTSADDKFMQKMFAIIEEHISNPELRMEMIYEEMGFSRSNFYRKIKALMDISPNDLIRNKRLEVATRLLDQGDMNITEIATHTGFNTLAYFTKCFKTAYGISPSEYIRNKKTEE